MSRRRRLGLAAVASLALLAAGCGGGSRVAGGTRSATATQGGLIPYSHCMRSHGVPSFPDPDGSGQIPKRQVVAAREGNPSRFDSATNACRSLLANGSLGPQRQTTITAADRSAYLAAAACMRSHGFQSFPDPTFPNNAVHTDIPAIIDQSSPRFKSAAEACTKLIPAGLPYGGRVGS